MLVKGAPGVASIRRHEIDGLVQDCSNSIANALELLQSCTNPSKQSLQELQPHCIDSLITGKLISIVSVPGADWANIVLVYYCTGSMPYLEVCPGSCMARGPCHWWIVTQNLNKVWIRFCCNLIMVPYDCYKFLHMAWRLYSWVSRRIREQI